MYVLKKIFTDLFLSTCAKAAQSAVPQLLFSAESTKTLHLSLTWQ